MNNMRLYCVLTVLDYFSVQPHTHSERVIVVRSRFVYTRVSKLSVLCFYDLEWVTGICLHMSGLQPTTHFINLFVNTVEYLLFLKFSIPPFHMSIV